MTRRRDCTCAGTTPGYPQHEDWCGKREPRELERGIDTFIEVMAHITVHPEDHDQNVWMMETQDRVTTCGTVGCTFGWAVALHNRLDSNNTAIGDDGQWTPFTTLGSQLLGLTGANYFLISAAENTVDDLFFQAAHIYDIPEEELRTLVEKRIIENS